MLCGLGTQEVLGGPGWTEEQPGLHLVLLAASLPFVSVDRGLQGPMALFWALSGHKTEEKTCHSMAGTG